MCKGNISKWPTLLPAALFADHITVQHAIGFSPYYLLHGVHPLLPCDLAKATFMVPRLKEQITEINLLITRICQIAKLPEDLVHAKDILTKSWFRSKEAFEAKFGQRMQWVSFKSGDLVLIHNSLNKNTVSINWKIGNRYMGPCHMV